MKWNTIFDFDSNKISSKVQSTYTKMKPFLKQQICKDCNSNAPLGDTGMLRNSALRTASLTNDYIVWEVPYAHFQHEGIVMVGEQSHNPWAHYGEKKVYTNRKLTYRQGESKWIDKTIAQRKNAWANGAKALFKKYYD